MILSSLGEVLWKLKRFEDGKTKSLEAIELDSNNYKAYNFLANSLYNIGKSDTKESKINIWL